jgi:hypothetical protein
MPSDPRAVRREHVEAIIADQVARWRPNTARNGYLALKPSFDWLADEGLIDASPMSRTRPPRVPEEPLSMVTDTTPSGRCLEPAKDGRSFEDTTSTGNQ